MDPVFLNRIEPRLFQQEMISSSTDEPQRRWAEVLHTLRIMELPNIYAEKKFWPLGNEDKP